MSEAKQQQNVATYRPVPFNFIDLEEKASDYLAKVRTDALKIAAEARAEVARLRETTLKEIEKSRNDAKNETEKVRTQLETLKAKLQEEEANFKRRKSELEAEAAKQKAALKVSEENARKSGYDDGFNLGQEEGLKKGYADGELQATIDYAEKIRSEAEVQLGTQLETLFPALQSMVVQLETAKQSFLQLWEQSAIHVARSIAERTIGRQLPDMIDVPLRLLRESLELGAGSTSVKIRLNPTDFESLSPQISLLVDELSGATRMEIVPDGRITAGGCVLETSLGIVDNQIESRLDRIEQELSIVAT